MTPSILDDYDPQGFYCEMLRGAASEVVRGRVSGLSIDALKERAAAANAELYNLGITFTIYSDAKTIDRILPFDVLPRILSAAEWRHIEGGIIQRITALNHLLDDIYHEQHVLRDGIIPPELILGNRNYRPLMRGVDLRTRPMSPSAAPTSCATSAAAFSCLRTTHAHPLASATSSRTAT